MVSNIISQNTAISTGNKLTPTDIELFNLPGQKESLREALGKNLRERSFFDSAQNENIIKPYSLLADNSRTLQVLNSSHKNQNSSQVIPKTNSIGEIIYDLGDSKIVIDPKRDRQLQALEKSIESRLYDIDLSGKKTFKDGITKKDVIKIIHEETHKAYGEGDQKIANMLVNGASEKQINKYYDNRDGDPAPDADGDGVTNISKLKKGTLVCTDFSALEHYLLNKNGIECEFTKGRAALGADHLANNGINHTWLTLKGGLQLIDPMQRGDEWPIKYIINPEDYKNGKPAMVVDSYGDRSCYSTTDQDRRINNKLRKQFEVKTDDLIPVDMTGLNDLMKS